MSEQLDQDASAQPDDDTPEIDLDSIDQEDLATYLHRRGDWEKKFNNRSTELGAREQEIRDRERAILEREAALSKAPTPEPKPSNKGPVIPWQSVMQQIGLDPRDDNSFSEPVTFEQMARIVEMVAQTGDSRMREIVGDLPRDEDGNVKPISLADLYTQTTSVASRLDRIVEEWDETLTPGVITEMQDEFEYADADDIRRAMTDAAGKDGKDWDEYVREAARKSHEKHEKFLQRHTKRKPSRRNVATRRLAAAKGAAVGGKKPASPWGDLRQYNAENPSGDDMET